MPSDVGSLTDLALALKANVLASLALTTDGAPTLEYLSPAAPPFDCCPFVSVHVGALTEETTSPLAPAPAQGHRGALGRINLAQLIVTVVRCAPKLNNRGEVSVEDKNLVAAQVQEDGWSMWNGLIWAVRNGEFGGLCADIHFDRGVSIAEQGGCVGWLMTVRAELEGIPNPGPST